jgi:inosose dehydratase
MSTSQIVVANAPISYGAFELTVGINPDVPDAETLLDQVADAGYAGIDLGPVGYLGDEQTLGRRLGSRNLGLAGGYIELPYSDHAALDAMMAELDLLLDAFDAVPDSSPKPLPTLADAGSEVRRSQPGRAAGDRGFGLDDAAWGRFGEGLTRVVEHCRSRGYEPTLHSETGTFVEAEWEIDRALELTDIGLCLDTGHLLVGGGDPLRVIANWGRRINHVHLKDIRLDVLRGIMDDGEPADAIWRRRAFCTLGEGDLPVDDVLDALRATGYSGWLVVEQDLMPEPSDAPGEIVANQVSNRRFLQERGL